MKRLKTSLILSLQIISVLIGTYCNAETVSEQQIYIKEILNRRSIIVAELKLLSSKDVIDLYKVRNYLPVWSEDGPSKKDLGSLIEVIDSTQTDGLNPSYYNLEQLKLLLDNFNSNKKNLQWLADLDMLMTDAAYTVAKHLRFGAVDPRSAGVMWKVSHDELNLGEALINNIIDGNDFEKFYNNLRPTRPEYAKLQKLLTVYRDWVGKGGWPKVANGRRKSVLGESNSQIESIKRRLVVTGELSASNAIGSNFDKALEGAVKRFQREHGLEVDGTVGAATLLALNMSAEERVAQIVANMERWRWMPRLLPKERIWVNIPDFTLNVFDGDKSILEMPVVVGTYNNKTPLLQSSVNLVVLNPEWNIPESITKKEMLPKLKQDPNYLKRQNIQVVQQIDGKTVLRDSSEVDFSSLQPGDFRLKQASGSGNALGKVKFLFPNPYAVYLHDTTAKSLFTHGVRAYSHGCVRVSQPLELASTIFSSSKEWDKSKIEQAIKSGRRKSISVDNEMPVFILYWTAVEAKNGDMLLLNDIYGIDRQVARALN